MKARFPLAIAIAALLTFVGSGPLRGEESPSIAFQPTGMWIWDNWFVHDGERWHAFYLQLPKAVGPERRWKDNDFHKHVGHATSVDLRCWQDEGPALCALSRTWNDRHIATGSILRHEGKWWMLFTGRGEKGDGVGLASSDDLTTWQTEPQPLFPLVDTFATESDEAFESDWRGETRRWIGISDPYALPEPRDGWLYLVLCARVLGVPLAESGCLAMVRSRDLRNWEAAGILAWPRCFERMETPQLWSRAGCWHLSFGGVLDTAWAKENAAVLPEAVRGRRAHENYCYALPSPDIPASDADLRHVAAPHGHYIMKVLPLDTERDVAIFTHFAGPDSGMTPPYPVSYGEDRTMRVDFESAPSFP